MSDTAEALKTLLDAGPKGTKTYALMDCALDSTIYPTIQASGCPNQKLYGESWQSGLADIAPHVVELTSSAKFSTELLTWDWYGNWGYFVQSTTSLSDLAQSFADLTTAKLSSGEEVFFRFFDPRVIRVFLAQASKNDLQSVFAKAERLVVPSAEVQGEGEAAIAYTLKNGSLAQSETKFDG